MYGVYLMVGYVDLALHSLNIISIFAHGLSLFKIASSEKSQFDEKESVGMLAMHEMAHHFQRLSLMRAAACSE